MLFCCAGDDQITFVDLADGSEDVFQCFAGFLGDFRSALGAQGTTAHCVNGLLSCVLAADGYLLNLAGGSLSAISESSDFTCDHREAM
ncbi:hypothetical protein, partial [Pseudomonas syringae]|uniref:hypothetical protein n=1 Tax=Pseudomonas syringae TaxID=317 RepID=UPI001C8136D0